MQLKFTNKNYLYGGLVTISLVLLIISGALPSWNVLNKNSICTKQILEQDEKYNYSEGIWNLCTASKDLPDGKCGDVTWKVALNPAIQPPQGETQYINVFARICFIVMVLCSLMNVINIFMGRDSFLDFGVDVNTLLGVAVLMGWFAHHYARVDLKCGTAPACFPVKCENDAGDDMSHESITTHGLAFYLFQTAWIMQFSIGVAQKFCPIDHYERKTHSIPMDGVGTIRSSTGTARSAGSHYSNK